MREKQKSFLLLLVVIYFFLVLYRILTFLIQINIEYYLYSFLIVFSFLIIKLSNSFQWITDLQNDIKMNDPKALFKKIISFFIVCFVLILRLLFVIFYIVKESGFSQYYLYNVILTVFSLGITVFFEEVYFKCGIYRILRYRQFPEWLNFVICSVLFTIIHVINIFPSLASFISVVIVVYFYQIFSLLVFKLNPSLYVVSVFHFIFDFIILL